jgi:DNA-binding MarR family transcriptional regulator
MTERAGHPQSPRDRILWILANSEGKMKLSDLRRRMTMKYADLDPILEELVKEGRITRLTSSTGKDMISLRADSRTKPGRGKS